jgi:tetratricopeptide (TPR) repeat protein
MTPNEHATFFQVAQRLALPGEILGAAFERCETAIADDPDGYQRAHREGALANFFQRACGEARRGARRDEQRHVLTDPSGEGLGGGEGYAVGADFSEDRREVAREAWRLAHSTATGKMTDYLAWFERQRHGETSQAIAESLEVPSATVRTGLRRAKQRIVELINQLRNTQTGRRGSDLDPDLEPVVAVYKRGDLVAMRTALLALEAGHREDPHWCLLMAWYFKAREEAESAERWLKQALVHADEPRVRAKILNTLGNVLDARGQPEAARKAWLRAHELDPKAPVPLLNLLANASERHDLADCQYYLQALGDLRARHQLDADEDGFVLRRLAENPELAWVRRTDPWRRGPLRWLKRLGGGLQQAAAAMALVLGLASAPAFPGCAEGGAHPGPLLESASVLSADLSLELGTDLGSTTGLSLVLLDAEGETLHEAPVRAVALEDGLLDGVVEIPMAVMALAPDFARLEGPILSGPILALRWEGSNATLESDREGSGAPGEVGNLSLRQKEHPGDEIGKDDYIRPRPTTPETPNGAIGKDDYIRPTPAGAAAPPTGTVDKDDYIAPAPKPAADEDSGAEEGQDGATTTNPAPSEPEG